MVRGCVSLFMVCLCIFCIPQVYGQYYYYNDKYYESDIVFEFGGSMNLMNSITDLGGQAKDVKHYLNEINWKNSNTAGGIYLGAMYRQIVGVRLEATYGSVKGYDSLLEAGTPRYRRNLSFKSDIREIAFLAEFHPIMLMNTETTPYFSPYIIAGAGWYSFNPQGKLNGSWIDLQPLNTEGQGFTEFPNRLPYRLSQANICGGLGVKYELFQTINLRLEWVHRYLFTDYLDDVSQSYIDPALFTKYHSPAKAALAQTMYKRGVRNNKNRGNPKDDDAYFSINFKLGFSFGRPRR